MKRINEDHFFEEYPKYEKLDELKKADILIMPEYCPAFSSDQQEFFRDLSSEFDINCKFFSEDQNKIICRFEESVKLEVIIYLGSVVSTIAGLLKIYDFLKTRLSSNNKFRITNIVRIGSDYYENEFEGTIDDYKSVVQELKSQLESENRKY